MAHAKSDPRAALAIELSRTWATAWDDFAGELHASPAGREHARNRACQILPVVFRCLSEATADTADALDLRTGIAATALQGIGEGYAQSSETWPIDPFPGPVLPDRERTSRMLRDFAIDGWCIEVGGEDAVPDLTPPPGSRGAPTQPSTELSYAVIADISSLAITNYTQFLRDRMSSERRQFISDRGVEYRSIACQQLAAYRTYLAALDEPSERAELPRRAIGMALLAVDGLYVGASMPSTMSNEEIPLLDPDFLTALVAESGVQAWLDGFRRSE